MLNKKVILILLSLICGFLIFNPSKPVFSVENNLDYSIGLDYLDLKEYRLAVRYFKQVIAIDPSNNEAHYNLGLAYKNLGMINEALAEFKNAFELAKGAKDNNNIKIEVKQPEQVKVKTEISKNDSQAQDYLDIGDIYYDNQMYRQSMEYYSSVLNMYPSNDYALYKIAKCYFALQKYNEANENISKAITLSPSNQAYQDFMLEVNNYIKSEKINQTQSENVAVNYDADYYN